MTLMLLPPPYPHPVLTHSPSPVTWTRPRSQKPSSTRADPFHAARTRPTVHKSDMRFLFPSSRRGHGSDHRPGTIPAPSFGTVCVGVAVGSSHAGDRNDRDHYQDRTFLGNLRHWILDPIILPVPRLGSLTDPKIGTVCVWNAVSSSHGDQNDPAVRTVVSRDRDIMDMG